MDGYPPELYQALSDKGHADLLKALINFIVVLLNTPYYGEKLDVFMLVDYSKLTKLEQIEASFRDLETKLTNPASKNLLSIAKRHLSFIFAEKLPTQRLPIEPTLYLTNKQQDYLQVIHQIPYLSVASADDHYYFWERYFHRMIRCGVELVGDHLSMLQDGPPKDQHTPECLWDRENDSVINMLFARDAEGPQVLCRLAPLSTAPNSDHQLSIFFGRSRDVSHTADTLTRMGLSPLMVCHDHNLQKTHDGKDTAYYFKVDLFCRVPPDKLEAVRAIFKSAAAKRNFRVNPNQILQACEIEKDIPPQVGNLHLVIFLTTGVPLLTLSFKYHRIPDGLITTLKQQLGPRIQDVSTDPINLTFHYKDVLRCGNIYNAYLQIENFLADFISIIAPYTAQPSEAHEALLGYVAAAEKFHAIVKEEGGAYLQRLPPPTKKQIDLKELDEKWAIIHAALEYSDTMWRCISDTVSERLFSEFSHLYKHDKRNPEFRKLLKSWRHNIPLSEIEDLITREEPLPSALQGLKLSECNDSFFKLLEQDAAGTPHLSALSCVNV